MDSEILNLFLQALIRFTNNTVYTSIILSALFIVGSFLFTIRNKKTRVSSTASDIAKRREKHAKKRAKKTIASNQKEMELCFSITSMLGLVDYLDDSIRYFYSYFSGDMSNKEVDKIIDSIVADLLKNETQNKQKFHSSINALVEDFKESKDTGEKVSTTAFQMYFISKYFHEGIEVNLDGEYLSNMVHILPTKVEKHIGELDFTEFVVEYIESISNRSITAHEYFLQKNFLSSLENLNKEHSLKLVDKKRPCIFCVVTSVSNKAKSDVVVLVRNKVHREREDSLVTLESLQHDDISVKQGGFAYGSDLIEKKKEVAEKKERNGDKEKQKAVVLSAKLSEVEERLKRVLEEKASRPKPVQAREESSKVDSLPRSDYKEAIKSEPKVLQEMDQKPTDGTVPKTVRETTDDTKPSSPKESESGVELPPEVNTEELARIEDELFGMELDEIMSDDDELQDDKSAAEITSVTVGQIIQEASKSRGYVTAGHMVKIGAKSSAVMNSLFFMDAWSQVMRSEGKEPLQRAEYSEREKIANTIEQTFGLEVRKNTLFFFDDEYCMFDAVIIEREHIPDRTFSTLPHASLEEDEGHDFVNMRLGYIEKKQEEPK